MTKKLKDELVFIISAFVIGFLYFSSHQESSVLLWLEIIFVLTFAVRKSIGLISLLFLKNSKKNNQHTQNNVTHISAKY